MKGSATLLKEFRLRSTPNRVAILNIFLRKHHAIGHADIEKNTPADFDRVTIYRTLKTFLDKGLIHKVLDDEGGLKYALCTEACSSSNHHHDHVHFKCNICGQTSCLSIDVPSVKLPKGYKSTEFNLLIQGICATCSAA